MNRLTLAAVCAATLLTLPAKADDSRRVLVVHPNSTAVINEPGHYYLARPVRMTADTGIQITASDVTLDLSGQQIAGPGGLRGTGIQIMNAAGVRLVNGNLENFAFGVVVVNSANVVLRDLLIRGQGLAVQAPPPEVGIMIVQSRNVVVEKNALYNVGLGIFVRGGLSWGNRVVDNNVTAGMNGLLGICYNPAPNDAMGPRGDLVSGNHIAGFGTGIQMSAASTRNIVIRNTIAFREMAIEDQGSGNMLEANTSVQMP